MIYQISSLFLHWRSRASFFSPERFSFYAFFRYFGGNFWFMRFTWSFCKLLFRSIKFSSCQSMAQVLFRFPKTWASIFFIWSLSRVLFSSCFLCSCFCTEPFRAQDAAHERRSPMRGEFSGAVLQAASTIGCTTRLGSVHERAEPGSARSWLASLV